MKEDKPRPLIEHIIELRSVLLSCFFYLLVGMLVSLFFSDKIYEFLITPLTARFPQYTSIIYTSVTEPITTELRISFYSSIILTFPFILKKIWCFVKIGLTPNEIKIVSKYGVSAILLFILGLLFAYYIAIPTILEGLSKWSFSQNAKFLPKMSESLTFILILMISFGISFQIPIIMITLDRLRILPINKQRKYWREYIALVTIISAIVTPPDAISMILLSIPMVLLYLMTMIAMKTR